MEFSETTGIAVEEHAAETGRIATFLLAPVVLDLDRPRRNLSPSLRQLAEGRKAAVWQHSRIGQTGRS